jgi:glucosamine--fructose-6-phosphate aminotransferase (isomerizing)
MRFLFDEQIASQPDAVAAVLQRPEPPAVDATQPLMFAGLGTSLHACRVAAAWAGYPAKAIDAQELALLLPVPRGAQVVVVSHGGQGPFGGAVLAKAHGAGARTFAVVGEHAPEPQADVVVRTCPKERAETHSVSYLCALAVLGRMLRLDLRRAPELLKELLSAPPPTDDAARLAPCDPVLLAGFGLDAISADEGALKLKEATFKWAQGMAVEQALHGPQAALRAGMGAILLRPGHADGGRYEALRDFCVRRAVAIVEPHVPDSGDALRPLLSAVPLQRLTAEIARLCGGDPDRSRSRP